VLTKFEAKHGLAGADGAADADSRGTFERHGESFKATDYTDYTDAMHPPRFPSV
jgi:hypothetical protein